MSRATSLNRIGQETTERSEIILDRETRIAARQLALHYGCSLSAAGRRAVISQRDALLGKPASDHETRGPILARLFELFEGNDPDAEVARLKQQDKTF